MEITISKQIEDYAIANPLATESDIKKHFQVSRQLVSKVFLKAFTAEQIEDRNMARLLEHAEELKAMMLADKTYAEMAEILGIKKNKVIRLIKSNPELNTLSNRHSAEYAAKVEAIRLDWNDNVPLATIAIKHGLGNNPSSATSFISKLRTRYGSDVFPIRTENRFNLEEKHGKYVAYKAEGKNDEEIAILLGYKNLPSMRSSFQQFKKKSEGV